MQEAVTFPTSPYHRYGPSQACYTDSSKMTHNGLSQGCHTSTALNESTLGDLPQACYRDFGENRHCGGFSSQAYYNNGCSTDNTHSSGLSHACYTHFNEASQSGYSQVCFADGSTASTPFVSAPSSPGRMFGPPGFYFSAPTSPNWAHRMQMHDDNAYMRRDYPSVIPFSWEEKPGTPKRSYDGKGKDDPNSFLCNSDFEFSARFSELDDPSMSPTPMSSAHELFFNGQIRPLRIPPRLEPVTARHGTHDGAFGFQGRAYELNRGVMPCSSSLSAPQSPRSALNCARGALACGGFSDVFDINRASPAPSVSAPQSPRSPLKTELSMKDPSPSNKSFNQSLDGGSSGNTAGSAGHRRARSFSPLRMFQREERMPKSALMEEPAVLSRDSSMGEKEQGSEEQNSAQKVFRKWTLKDLLHRRSGGENRSTTSRASSRRSSTSSMESSSRGSGRSEASQYSSSFMEPNMKENGGKTSHGSSKGKASSINRPHRVPSQKSNKGSVSPHELHYMMHKAQAEELRKKTFLPYRQGLLGCLGFTSRSYKAVSTISKTLQSVSG